MSTTVGGLMGRFGQQPLDFDTNPTPSRKEWTASFEPFDTQYIRPWDPEVRELDRFLGGSEVPSEADFVGLASPAHTPNNIRQLISSEDDMTRDFDQCITSILSLAFTGQSATTIPGPGQMAEPAAPTLWQRSLVSSPGSHPDRNNNPKIVDYQMTMSHQKSSLEQPAMIGEFKKARSIKGKEWLGRKRKSSSTIRLMREMRVYMAEYRCPQAFLWDGRTLILIQLRALSAEEIQREDCIVDICVVPRESSLMSDFRSAKDPNRPRTPIDWQSIRERSEQVVSCSYHSCDLSDESFISS